MNQSSPGSVPLAGSRLGSPLLQPGKILGVGANYCDANGAPPKGPPDPILFFKPASSLAGHNDPVTLPFETGRVVAEVELAIVIGKSGHRVPVSEAMDHIFGYTIANDLTAPDVMLGDSHESPLYFQQGRGKGFPDFCPLGPWIVTRDAIPDPERLMLQQHINGHIELSGSSALMHHSPAVLVSEVSHAFGLAPGDIILSGSPRPTAAGRQPLTHGDILESRISGIGVLRNQIVAESRQSANQPIRIFKGPNGSY